MAIGTLDDYIGSVKQVIPYSKTTTRTTVANIWFSIYDLAGNPGAVTLAGTSTSAGVVPVAGISGTPNGYPYINFTSGLGYISTVDFGSTVPCRLMLYDVLFKAGAYSFNANTTLSGQPSYSGRIPSGTDYTGLQIWIETVTAFTGNLSINVNYTNQDGTTGQSTGTIATGVAPTVGRLIQLPLAAGDSGVQKIEKVVATVATVGTFNVLVLRPLWSGRVVVANAGDSHGIDRTGMPQIWATSALAFAVNADSTSSGLPDCQVEIASN